MALTDKIKAVADAIREKTNTTDSMTLDEMPTKITSIEKVKYNDEVYCIECTNTDEPYFTLPNGLITHNCRLRNGIKDQLNDFSYSLGAGGIMTGSMNVITLNMNRFIQDSVKYAKQHNTDIKATIEEHLKNQIYLIHK